LLLLDEPLAALDPLARREFLTTLAEVTIDGDVTVMLSSHLLHDLERVCNHLILLSESHVRLCDDIDDLLSSHQMLVGPRRNRAELERAFPVVQLTQTERQSRVIARLEGEPLDPSWDASPLELEEIVLAYMSQDESVSAGALHLEAGSR
jgi:ABC-2 type transport system ATP-binding protein